MSADELSALNRLMAGTRVGVLLDIDGTLSTIAARPEDARLVNGAREAIAGLVPKVTLVAVISGRTTAEARALLGLEGIEVLGSYGLGDLPSLPEGLVAEVRRAADAEPGSRVEPKGGTVAVHVRATEDPDAAERRLLATLSPIAGAAGLVVTRGKRVLELVPEGRDLKGEAVERTIAAHHLDAVLYAGDDVADLGAFAALNRAAAEGVVTIAVAARGAETPADLLSAADLVVEGPEGIVRLLGQIVV